MIGENPVAQRKKPRSDGSKDRRKTGNPDGKNQSSPVSTSNGFYHNHAMTAIIFLISFFFILSVTNPALYTNDEWITANQLHQLTIGHKVTFSEGKYGVTENGTVSAYFTFRQNYLQYSLALPLAALPVVKLFGLLGDNFRLIVILTWSLCPVLAAFLLETFYPDRARIHGIRIFFPVLVLALVLFMGNILLYKQFPFSAPDAPFEVAALVFINQVFFALTVAVVFAILKELISNIWMALFGALATIASSSFIFWAGTAKDHMLTAFVFTLVIFCFVLYLSYRKWHEVFLAFVFSGLLIWIRPEVGFFVTVTMGLFFCISAVKQGSNRIPVSDTLFSLLPATGVFLGGIPFFINNFVISHNWLIPAFDLPRDLEQSGGAVTVPLPISQVATSLASVNQTTGLTFSETISRVRDMIVHAAFNGFTFDNLVQGFIGTMTFPQNHSIGFLIMCPLIVAGVFAGILWWKRATDSEPRKELLLFLSLMIITIFISYLTRFNTLNTSLGTIPDMRYLSPAYIPCGLLSVVLLSRIPFFNKPKEYLTISIIGIIIAIPVSFFLLAFVHPFGSEYSGYSTLFQYIVVAELAACFCVMVISRWYCQDGKMIAGLLPFIIILSVITVFTFQVMLTGLYGMIMKMNGYPFWIPIIREGINMFIVIQYALPV